MLPVLLQQFLVMAGALQGGQACQLDELGCLPDDQLAQLRPVVSPDCRIFVEGDHVWSQFRHVRVPRPPLKLFAAQPENLLVFNLFDGRHTLGEIGQQLVCQLEWEEGRAFAHTRALFLALANRLVCRPWDAGPES
jgi:hypothetical protein